VLFVLCAVLRLARFNVEMGEEDSHQSFSGLPSPAAAGALASIVVAMPGLRDLADSSSSEIARAGGTWLVDAASLGLPVVTLGLACLMVSRIRYPHVFNQLFRGRRNFRHLVQLIFALVAILAVHELIPLVFFCFVLGSPIRALWAEVVARRWLKLLRGASNKS
jgi:CDP-diacylglycerol--serine O-phosphatidyltransferase